MINRLAIAALTIAATSPAWAQAKKATEFKTQDVMSIADQIVGLLPKALGIMSFVLLAMLLWQCFKRWKQMTLMELAAVVIAFSLVAGRG